MILKKLAALADKLDKMGLTDGADLADKIILSAAGFDSSGLPHDDDDQEEAEMDEEFEKYLQGLESGEVPEPESEEFIAGDEESELRLQLDAISKMLSDDRLSESEKEMLAGVLQSLRAELGNETPAWGAGSFLGESPDEGSVAHSMPIAEASKKG